MGLRSVTLRGFKSFPDRTKLEFASGVSVIVGPNGSGKSNVTDAVLWALGEQSPLAVRGQKMQDVIFAGGHGVPSRASAEVEVVIDDASGAFGSEFAELSVRRRLDRSGEGEYRLNGARCRLVDVLEALSDSGLGKEMHSVVSQGRVEAIIHSRPHDRRMLIEEAAGLGKHRKRRRRAQLKLERTEANLARALDVEREARSRLRPLKRQADAAALHERVERQVLEARLELDRDAVRASAEALVAHEREVSAAHAARDAAERELVEAAQRRERIERAFAEHSRVRDARSAALHAARSAAERIAMRTERARDVAGLTAARSRRRADELESLERAAAEATVDGDATARVAELEAKLTRLSEDRAREVEAELASLHEELAEHERGRDALRAGVEERRRELQRADATVNDAHAARAEAERILERARREAAATGADLASVNQFLRSASQAPGDGPSLGDGLVVEAGYEQAVAAVLGPLLHAAIADDVPAAERLLDRARDGGSAIIGTHSAAAVGAPPPAPGARRLLEVVHPTPATARLAERLLSDAWLVDSLDGIADGFTGVAATRAGRVLFASTGELRQAAAAGEGRILERRARRDELVRASERAAGDEAAARASSDAAHASVGESHAARDRAAAELRDAQRALDDAAEQVRRTERLIESRRAAPDEGPGASRLAALEAELRAERRLAEQAARELEARQVRIRWLRGRRLHDERTAAVAAAVAETLALAGEAVTDRLGELRQALEADEALAASTASDLSRCAREESEIQSRLREASDALTAAEVRAQRLRDAAEEARAGLDAIVERLGFEPPDAPGPLSDDDRQELHARLERLERRRAQIGPVNPLAGREYEDALAHVSELESQRQDLQAALEELEGVIKETDRRIRQSFEETFETAARNFEETVGHLFPGGRGRLRLVNADGPRATEDAPDGEGEATDADADEAEPDSDEPGVEIEVTPAGKATKRLSLMSGGEKSLVALAFLFAVFLARPCPFYILDEVEAALDDANIDRFLELVRRSADRAQFIIVTHQKRTMDAADCLYGVSMGKNGVSKVVSRKLGEGGALEAADAPGEQRQAA